MGNAFATLASLDRTALPKAVLTTAATRAGASRASVFAGEGSPDQTAASARKG